MSRKLFLGFAALAIAIAAGVVAFSQSSQNSASYPPQGDGPSQPIRPSSAVEVVRATTPEYFKRAQSVVLAKCTNRRVDYGSGGNIFTYYEFQTEEIVKGAQKARFEVGLLGGTIGNVTIQGGLDRDLNVGQEYVLMLGPDNSGGYATLNPAAIFVVRTDPSSGRRAVVPGGDGLALYDKSTGRSIGTSRESSFLDDFIFSLKKTIE